MTAREKLVKYMARQMRTAPFLNPYKTGRLRAAVAQCHKVMASQQLSHGSEHLAGFPLLTPGSPVMMSGKYLIGAVIIEGRYSDGTRIHDVEPLAAMRFWGEDHSSKCGPGDELELSWSISWDENPFGIPETTFCYVSQHRFVPVNADQQQLNVLSELERDAHSLAADISNLNLFEALG